MAWCANTDTSISCYVKPKSYQDDIEEVHTLLMVGDGVNGHPSVIHGGTVASVLDDAMGILQSANHDWHHSTAAGKTLAKDEALLTKSDYFTAELKIKYLKPVYSSTSGMHGEVHQEGW